MVRPTSETIIGAMFAKWVQSYRDLPILINQWANVVRWELRTRMFLRTAEFLWQEGHTVHATSEEAMEETLRMLDVYAEFAEKTMAMPVIKGEKTVGERFPGALHTFSIEAMMQDNKALQAGTSHFLGQNFSKAQGIKYLSAEGNEVFGWTTSWGVSTRLIGALIMTHSDDDGLILPPKLAPNHVVILPISRNEEDHDRVHNFCHELARELRGLRYHDEKLRVNVDDRDIRGGEKTWQHIKQGVPIRLEIGPRDMDEGSVFMGRRDRAPRDKTSVPRAEFLGTVCALLDDIQNTLFQRAKVHRDEHTVSIDTIEDFRAHFSNKKTWPGFALCPAVEDDRKYEDQLKSLKVTARCIPQNGEEKEERCIFTGEPTKRRIIFAGAY